MTINQKNIPKPSLIVTAELVDVSATHNSPDNQTTE